MTDNNFIICGGKFNVGYMNSEIAKAICQFGSLTKGKNHKEKNNIL